jgi:23S rRNA pseudouridine1911/1915/1917 synthase
LPKPQVIPLGRSDIPILYEDRSVLAIDKPAGWLLIPSHWENTGRNLQLALESSMRSGEFWAKSRNLRFLKFVHRLDAETSGILLFARSAGGVPVYSKLFESRQMHKHYLAVVDGNPEPENWVVSAPIGESDRPGRMQVDPKNGRDAVTEFTVLARNPKQALLLAKPITGRTHQIRVHLKHSGTAVAGDTLYGGSQPVDKSFPMGLRAVGLAYHDPFTRRRVEIRAAIDDFCRAFGFREVQTIKSAVFPFDRGNIA